MSCRRSPLLPPLLLLLLGAVCLATGSPAADRPRRSIFQTLPGGLPLEALFALCEVSSTDDDIGPCLADLLRGAIDKARPSFDSGLQIGRDRIVLEPLDLDDIDPKPGKSLQVSVSDIKLFGIGTLDINDITFNSTVVALDLTFSNVTVTGNLKASYLFLSANAGVDLELTNLTVLVSSGWGLDVNPDDPSRLDILLRDAMVEFKLDGINPEFHGLGKIGSFLSNIIKSNEKTLAKFLLPELEKTVTKKLNGKLNRIKIAD